MTAARSLPAGLLLICFAAHGQETLIPTPTAQKPAEPAWSMPLQWINSELPYWLRFNAQYRSRVETSGHIGFQPGSDTYNLSQLRLELAFQPVNWFRVVGEAQDSEVFFNNRVRSQPSYENTWDIRQAFVQVGSDRTGWFDAIAGRQMLSFGDERLIGPSDWLNQGRTFDVARVDLHNPSFRTSIFAGSVVIARNGVVDHHYQGNNIYGLYNTFENAVPNGTLDLYVFWRVSPANLQPNDTRGRGALNETTPGFRVSGDLPRGFDYDVEMALQRGSLGPMSIAAWAGHWNLGRTFRTATEPRVFLESNHASGTKSQSGPQWGTFDELYPSSHNKMDFADQAGWRNIQQVRGGVTTKPGRAWTITATWEGLWRASRADGLYTSGGTLSVPASPGTQGRFIGHEADVVAAYQWKKAAELGFGYGHLFTGRFLNSAGRTADYNYPFAYAEFYLTNTREH